MIKKLRFKILLIVLSLFSVVTTAQQISSFTLMNANDDIEIKTLTDGETLSFADLATDQLSLRANVSGTVGSIVFEIDNEKVQTENLAPYALVGNSGSDYKPWVPQLKTYTFKATAYATSRARGSVLDTYSVSITFAAEAPAEEPVDEPVDTSGPAIFSLVLINADTDEDIATITTGSVFNLNEIGTSNLSIRAETGTGTESVIFGYQDRPSYQIENLPVYAIAGNTDEDYNPWNPDLGANIITATAYSDNRGAGTAGNPLTVNFEIVDEETSEEEEEEVPVDEEEEEEEVPVDEEEQPEQELPAIVRINSGGETVSFDDSVFISDEYFAGDGKSYSNNSINEILKTDQDAIYKTERSTNSRLGSFSYNIPVTNGDYDINLHFAEIYFGATGEGSGGTGKRVFSVSIEGEEVISDFDLNAEEGPMTAVVKSFTANVSDESLDIDFKASVDQPKVSALEVFGEGSLITPSDDDDCAWDTLANSGLSKVEAQSVKVNDKLYVLAGFLSGLKITPTTEIYDPSTDRWSTGAPMPTAVTHMGAVRVGNEIWILAGFAGNHPGTATDKVQIYNTVTDSWSAGPALPNPRGSGAAAYSEGKIHFFGGLLPDRRTDVGEHYMLDVNNVSAGWEKAADMPDPRNHLSAATVNGKIYAIGGQFGHDGGVQDQDFLDVYDPVTDSWTRKADLPSARSHFEPGTIVHNGKIIIVGGRRGGFFFEDVTEYDPISDSWSERCELPSKLLAPSAKVFGNRLIVANGGEGGTCCPKNSTISIAIEPEIAPEPEPDMGLSVLIYHETNGFRHGSIGAGIDMIEEFGNDLDWDVDNSRNSDVFNTNNLEKYDVVVWLNTSGDGLLTSTEQDAFEDFIQGGSGFLGIHAATDTYRNGSWPWYNDLVGGIVQVSPNHTANNTNATMDVVGSHPAVAHLGNTWNKSEEYYYWERNGGYLFEGNIDLLNVRSTGANSYDAPRPITWYKNFDGGRSFYTALGHNNSDYQSNNNFKTMVREAIIWASEGGQSVAAKSSLAGVAGQFAETRFDSPSAASGILVYPNPTADRLFVASDLLSDAEDTELKVFGLNGNLVRSKTISRGDNQITVGGLPSGYYLVSIKGQKMEKEELIFIE